MHVYVDDTANLHMSSYPKNVFLMFLSVLGHTVVLNYLKYIQNIANNM